MSCGIDVTRDYRQKIEGFKNKHQGERCVIIGNGPSLNKMDLSFLQQEICFGLNKIYLGFARWNFMPQYYVAVNSLVLEQNAQEIANIPTIKFISNRGTPYLQPQADLIFLQTDPYTGRDFSIDIASGVQEGNTVTYVALQLAYYMGFKTVVLIGIDHNFTAGGKPHQEVVAQGQDLNHFDPNYFSQGVRWHLPDLKGSEKFYKIAYANYWLDDRQVIDATVDGKCTVFPKQDYQSLFC